MRVQKRSRSIKVPVIFGDLEPPHRAVGATSISMKLRGLEVESKKLICRPGDRYHRAIISER
jgi:hypothetical protein